MGDRPLIVDLGKKKKKDVKRLKLGEGILVGEVQAAVEKALAGTSASGNVVPVVMLYEKRAKRGMSFPKPPMIVPMDFPTKFAKAFGLS